MQTTHLIGITLIVLATGACGAVTMDGKALDKAWKVGSVSLEENFSAPATRSLVRAACDGDEASVDAALAAGGEINDPGQYQTPPLFWVIGNTCSVAGVRLLLARGADIEAKQPLDETPLWVAAGFASTEILQALIDAGANVNVVAQGNSPLVSSILRNRMDNMRLLVKAGADVNWVRGSFSTAATTADAMGNYEVLLFLLQNGYSFRLDSLLRRLENSSRAHDERQDLFRKQAIELLQKR